MLSVAGFCNCYKQHSLILSIPYFTLSKGSLVFLLNKLESTSPKDALCQVLFVNGLVVLKEKMAMKKVCQWTEILEEWDLKTQLTLQVKWDKNSKNMSKCEINANTLFLTLPPQNVLWWIRTNNHVKMNSFQKE